MLSALKCVFSWTMRQTKIVLFVVGFVSVLDWLKKILPNSTVNLTLSSAASLLGTTSLSSLFCRPLMASIVIFLIASLHIASKQPRRERTRKAHQRSLELLKPSDSRLLTYDNEPDNSSSDAPLGESSCVFVSNYSPSRPEARESQKTKLVEAIPPWEAAEVVVKHVSSELKREEDMSIHIGSEVGILNKLLPPVGTTTPSGPRPPSHQKKPIVILTVDQDPPPLASSLPTDSATRRTFSSSHKKATVGFLSKLPSPSSLQVRGHLAASHETKPIIKRPSVQEFWGHHPAPASGSLPTGNKTAVAGISLDFPSYPPPAPSLLACHDVPSSDEKKPVSSVATPRRRARLGDTNPTSSPLRHDPEELGSWKRIHEMNCGSYESTDDQDNFSREEQQLFFLDEEVELVNENGEKPSSVASWWPEAEGVEEERVVMVDKAEYLGSFEENWLAITGSNRDLKKCETWDVPPESPAPCHVMKKWETFRDPRPAPMVPTRLWREQQDERDELKRRADAFIQKIRHDMFLQKQKSAEERYMEMIKRGTM